MQPIKHKPPFDKELIAHIKKSLMAHEETYVEGAWEKFNSDQKTKQKPILWLGFLRGAAAVLLLASIAFLFMNKKPTVVVPAQLAKQKPEAVQVLPATEAADHLEIASVAKAKESSFSSHTAIKIENFNKPIQTNVEDKNEVIATATTPTNHLQNTIASITDQPEQKAESVSSTQNKEAKKADIMEFLTNETKKNAIQQIARADRDNKFTIGLVVAPSFGNTKKLNMGYGVSMDYSLSDKISLNSGIAYSEMTASKRMSLPASASLINSYGNAKNLEAIEEQVVGIDIPLEIKYHVNKNFYANVGVSALAVINQKRGQTFVQDMMVQMSPSPGSNGLNSPGGAGSAGVADRGSAFLVNTERTTTSSSAISDYSYLGFYNFSIGYQKKISKNHSMAIEPFLKLPMKELNNENLKLIGSGVKLKFDF